MSAAIVVLVQEWLQHPVYHASEHRRVPSPSPDFPNGRLAWYTGCGLDLDGRGATMLRQDHAAAFARPCRRCYEVAP